MSSLNVFTTQVLTDASTTADIGYLRPTVGANAQALGFYVAWGTGVSAGVVKIETAPTAEYTGTWKTLSTVTYATGSPMVDFVQLTGAGLAYRVKVSTNLTGGTVTVTAVAN